MLTANKSWNLHIVVLRRAINAETVSMSWHYHCLDQNLVTRWYGMISKLFGSLLRVSKSFEWCPYRWYQTNSSAWHTILAISHEWWTWLRHQMETFPRYWPFFLGKPPMDSPHKGQWCGALMCSLICDCTNGWANNRDVGEFRRHRAHYDVTVIK